MLGSQGRPVEMPDCIGKDEERTDDGRMKESTTAYLYFLRDLNSPSQPTCPGFEKSSSGQN